MGSPSDNTSSMQNGQVDHAESESNPLPNAAPSQPSTASSSRTFRVRGIPLEASASDVESALNQYFASTENQLNGDEPNLYIKSLSADTRGRSQVATISLRTLPTNLTSGHEWTWSHLGQPWTVDDHFYGLTVLYSPPAGNHTFESVSQRCFSWPNH